VHATITKDVRRVSPSCEANRQCTLVQFEALTSWGVAELIAGSQALA